MQDMQANLLLLLRTLSTYFKAVVSASFLFCFVMLAVMLCLPVLEVVWFVSPLLFSAGLCFTVICLFMALEDFQGDEFLLARGVGDANLRQVEQTTDNAECCIDIDDIEIIKSGWEENVGDCLVEKLGYKADENEGGYLSEKLASLEQKLVTGNDTSFGDGDEISFQIDRLAEGLWDCFFGRYSRWNYKEFDGW